MATILIDPLAIKLSSARKHAVVVAQQAAVINALFSMLPDAGWTVLESFKSTGGVEYPFGYPIGGGSDTDPKRPVGCGSFSFFKVGDLGFTLYNPHSEEPLPNVACIMVALGDTETDGLQNLCDAITANTGFDASYSARTPTGWTVTLQSKVAGPDLNGTTIDGDGRFGTQGSIASNGGFRFESAPEASVYQVTITGVHYLFGSIRFEFTLNGAAVPLYTLMQQGENFSGSPIGTYNIICNGYGFAIFADVEDGFPQSGRQTSLFAMAPYVPTSSDPDVPGQEVFDTSAYAVFICGPFTFRQTLSWQQGIITTSLDATPATFANTGGWPRALVLRSPGPPLLTQAQVPIVTGAYVMFGTGPFSGANVVGKLWDCAIIHGEIGSGAIIAGQRYWKISSQNGGSGGTTSSLMWLID